MIIELFGMNGPRRLSRWPKSKSDSLHPVELRMVYLLPIFDPHLHHLIHEPGRLKIKIVKIRKYREHFTVDGRS